MGKPLPTKALIDRPQGQRLARAYQEKNPNLENVRNDAALRKAIRDINRLDKVRSGRNLTESEGRALMAALATIHPDKPQRSLDFYMRQQ